MATDYDAPRKTDDVAESFDALEGRLQSKTNDSVDAEEIDTGEFEFGQGDDLSNVQLDVVVVPPQEDEFTCVQCFLVKHRTQLDHMTDLGPICKECASD
jgi:hypothetical protein